MPRPALAAVVLAGFSCVAALAPPAAAAEPTPEQRQQIEQVIRDYLTKNPEVLIEALQAAERKMKDQQDERAREAVAAQRDELVNDPAAPVGGNPKGDVTIVEFFDYRCPYCKQVEPTLEALVKEDGKLRIVYKEYPILGPESVLATRVALAAFKQGARQYGRFHGAMMNAKGQITEEVILKIAADAGLDMAKIKSDMTAPEVEAAIKRNYGLAAALNVHGTPAFIVGDAIAPGAVDLDTLRKMVADARKSG